MTRLFWVDGRLSWPLVSALIYVAASMVAADYIWRVLVIPFDTLLLYAAIAEVVGAIALIGICSRFKRQRRP